MSTRALVVVLLAAVLIGSAILISKKKPMYAPEVPEGVQTVEGMVEDVAASARVITIRTPEHKEIFLALDEGSATTLASIRRGFTLRARGGFTKPDTMVPYRVDVIASPNILVFEPQPNGEAGLPLVIRGEARVFENTVLARVRDGDGTVLTERFATADAPDIGQYGAFEFTLSYPAPGSASGVVEVYTDSPKDGSEIDKVTIPVRFRRDIPATNLKVYFTNPTRDPEALDCKKVFPVERRVAKTNAPARAALEELLAGPTILEAREDYGSSINMGVNINSLTIQNGTAKADFDEMLEAGVGGSCRVAAIRAQIERTLLQFTTVKQVVVSVNGRTEDILQP